MNIEAICHEEKTGNLKGGGLGSGGGMVGDVQGCGWLTGVKKMCKFVPCSIGGEKEEQMSGGEQ